MLEHLSHDLVMSLPILESSAFRLGVMVAVRCNPSTLLRIQCASHCIPPSLVCWCTPKGLASYGLALVTMVPFGDGGDIAPDNKAIAFLDISILQSGFLQQMGRLNDQQRLVTCTFLGGSFMIIYVGKLDFWR